MKAHIKLSFGNWQDVDCERILVPLGVDESETLAISVLNSGEVVVIRHGSEYPDGGECVYSEVVE
jgi:hypothetical protein